MGSATSWEGWDPGSIPRPVQWAKDPALQQLWCGSQLRFESDPWPGNSIRSGVNEKKGKKKEKRNFSNFPHMVLSPGCRASKSISFPGTACLITMKNLNLEDAFVFQMNQQRLREGWRHGHHPGVHQRRSQNPGLLKPNSHTLPLAPQKLLLRELLSRKNHLMKVHQDHEKKKAATLWRNILRGQHQ